MQHTRLESSESGGWSIEHSKRKAERQSGADFVYRAAIGESVPETDVETEIVAHLPNETDQSGYRVELAECLFDEKLCNRPDRPF